MVVRECSGQSPWIECVSGMLEETQRGWCSCSGANRAQPWKSERWQTGVSRLCEDKHGCGLCSHWERNLWRRQTRSDQSGVLLLEGILAIVLRIDLVGEQTREILRRLREECSEPRASSGEADRTC